MFKRILVPLDGSQLSTCTLPHVVAMAQASNATITLLQVMEREANSAVINPVDWQLRKTEAQTYLDEISAQLAPFTDAQIETVLLEGRVADRILEYAQHAEIDLVALSSHGQGGINGWNVSSIAQKVIQRIGISILLVRAYQMGVECQRGQWAALHYEQILAPLDGSQRAEHVLPFATSLASQQEAQLHLVHVVAPPVVFQRMPLTSEDEQLAKALFERNQQQAAAYFEQIGARLSPRPQTHVLTGTNIPAALHTFTHQQGIDLVIVSAHGHGGQRQWPYGSLVSSFIDHGVTPILMLQDMPNTSFPQTPAERAAAAINKQAARSPADVREQAESYQQLERVNPNVPTAI